MISGQEFLIFIRFYPDIFSFTSITFYAPFWQGKFTKAAGESNLQFM